MSKNWAEKLKSRMSAKNITAYIVFGAIIAVFALFGMPQSMGGAGAVAKVNAAFISIADYQQEEQRIQQYYSNLFGGGFDFSSQRQLLQQQALESLVRNEVIFQAAQKEGVIATDAEVRDYIVKDIPFFQQDGIFQRDLYTRYLEMTRATPGDFENKVRKDILNLRIRRLFEASSWPLTIENAKMTELKGLKVNYLVARIEDSVTKSLPVSAQEVNSALASEEFAKRVQSYFDSNKSEFESAEQVRAQHILIMAPSGNASAEQEALKKINSIKSQAATSDFGKLAAQYSEDPGSKQEKGDLGYFSRGKMVPEFEDAAFSLAVGQVSEPIKTSYGYHLIKVLDKKAATQAQFETAKLKIAQQLLSQDKSQKLTSDLEAALTKGDETQVNAELQKLGVKWEETGFQELGNDTWTKLQSPVARDAALEATPQSPLVKRLVRDASVKYVVKLKEFKSEPTVINVNDQLTLKRRAEGMFEAWMNQYRAKSDIEMNTELFNSMN